MYGKYFASTFTGSMVGAGSAVFAVWGYVIANKRRDQTVELNPTLLAMVLGETEEKVAEAIDFLLAPDPRSRSPEHDGRRLLHLGAYLYRVVNGDVYRAIGTHEEQKALWAEQKRAQRAAARGREAEPPLGDPPEGDDGD